MSDSFYHGRQVTVRGVAPESDGQLFQIRQGTIQKLAELYPELAEYRSARPGSGPSCWLDLVPEPDNPYDRHAVAVYVQVQGVRVQLGYLPREVSDELWPEVEQGLWLGKLSQIVGGREPGQRWGLRLTLYRRRDRAQLAGPDPELSPVLSQIGMRP